MFDRRAMKTKQLRYLVRRALKGRYIVPRYAIPFIYDDGTTAIAIPVYRRFDKNESAVLEELRLLADLGAKVYVAYRDGYGDYAVRRVTPEYYLFAERLGYFY